MPSFTKTYHAKSYPAISPTRPELSAKGKVVLITGAGSGIARATAIAFAEAGASAVVLCGRRTGPLEETQSLIEAKHTEVKTITQSLDVSSEESVASVFRDITSSIGPVDIVVNGAGHLSEAAKVIDSTLANFWDTFEVQVKGTFLVAQHWLRNKGQKDPTFLSFNSALGHTSANLTTTCPASYASSKCAAAKLVEWIAKENVGEARFYSLHPGIVQTDMSRRSLEMTSDPEGLKARLPWDDVKLSAHFCVWLASPEGLSIPTGKYLWINWNVEELKTKAQEMANDPHSLILTLSGWPFADPETTD